MNETSHDIAVEQYLWWQSRGLTHREMMWAIHRSWRYDRTPVHVTMTGDEIVAEIAHAWNGLKKLDRCLIDRKHVLCLPETWFEHDARGIPLAKVCDNCRELKLSKYRPEVLTNPQYAHDEPLYDGQSPYTFQIDEESV
tara:strand:+ start:823 stop:1239 length:417 start_codon:yes stop_codon:yes gene_type:complete